MKKKTVSLFLCIVLLIGLTQNYSMISVSAITQSEVQSKLNSLMSQYVGKTATSAQMYLGSQCKGFANWIFLQIFGIYVGPYPESAKYRINTSTCDVLGELAPGSLNESSCKSLLQKGAPGDYIQVQRSTAKGSGPHSMILVSVNNSGIEVFDANSDDRNSIKRYTLTYSEFDATNKGMSLLRAKSYKPNTTIDSLTIDGDYSKYMPLTAYLSVNGKVYPRERDCSTLNGGEIWASDECKINEVYTNGWCQVSYPGMGGKLRTAYTPLSNFISSTNLGFSQKTAQIEMKAYSRADLSSSIGGISKGDVCYLTGTSGSSTQAIYPTSSGYKLGWSTSSSWSYIEPGYDIRFNPYCPIKGYVKGSEKVSVYNSDFSTLSGGKIFVGDFCTIDKVYNNGWCQVTYPSVVTASGFNTGFVPLSTFVHDTSATPVSYTANAQINVYTRSDMSNSPDWWIFSGDKFFKISALGNVCQVLYPIDAQYGGGYKIGWIYNSNLPVTTYAVNYNANGGSGAPVSQTKRYNENLVLSSTIPTKTGYTFAGWSTSASSKSVAYTPGSNYTSNSAITLYAVWNPVKYEILYNMNGGFANIQSQIKSHGTNIVLSSVVPEKTYGIYMYAYENEAENITKVLNCKFLGWNPSNTATTALYQPGNTFTTNSNVTLYAIWSNPVIGDLEVPSRAGFEFLGWYTQETGGTKVTNNTIIGKDTTIYAHWKLNEAPTPKTYTVTFNANGGINAPASQTKTENVNLVLTKSTPTRNGYTFKGWATTASSQTVSYKPGATYTANSNVTLYAVWEKNNVNVNGPKFVISNSSARVGSTVTVDISIKNNPGITAFNFAIDFPKEILTLTNVEYKDLFSSRALGSQNLTNPFTVSWFSMRSENETANGVIATLTFLVNKNVKKGHYPITLTYDRDNVFNASFTNVEFSVDNGEIAVIDYISGDVNGDTKVNMKDIVLLQQYLNGWGVEIDINAANVNADASVNMKDIVLLQQYLNGWNVTLK